MEKKIVYLTGFMGAGKSTIGPILANTLGWDFFDLDKEIERKTSKSISLIFRNHGEEYFRSIESSLLTDISSGNEKIISLGGGTVAYNNNFDFIKATGFLVYLKTSLESVHKRLKNKIDRPILLNPDGSSVSPEEFYNRIKEIYEQRSFYYNQADITIDTDSNNIGRTVDKLTKLILKFT